MKYFPPYFSRLLDKSENLLFNPPRIASRLAIKSSPVAKLTVGFSGANNSCALCKIAIASAAFIGSLIDRPALLSIN